MATAKQKKTFKAIAIGLGIALTIGVIYHFTESKFAWRKKLLGLFKKAAKAEGTKIDEKAINNELKKLKKKDLKVMHGFAESFINTSNEDATVTLMENFEKTGLTSKIDITKFHGLIFDV